MMQIGNFKKTSTWLLIAFGILIIGSALSPKTPENKKNIQSDKSLPDFIKTITNSNDIILTEQSDSKGSYLADIRIAKDPLVGGHGDWNMVANETFNYCKTLLDNPTIARLHFTYYSPENKNLDWAHLWIKRSDLPSNWKESYLLFFGAIKPDAGSVQSTQWLCDFYKKYTYARPHGEIPEYCSRY